MTERAAKVKVELVVLWEDELRLAAKAIRAAVEQPEDTPEELSQRLWNDAVNACAAALWHVDDDLPLIVSKAPKVAVRRVRR